VDEWVLQYDSYNIHESIGRGEAAQPNKRPCVGKVLSEHGCLSLYQGDSKPTKYRNNATVTLLFKRPLNVKKVFLMPFE